MPGHILPVKRNGQVVKGLWRVVVECGIDPATGKRRRMVRHFRGRRSEAEDFLAELLAEVNRPDRVERSRVTIGQWLETWLNDYKKLDLRPTSWDRYRGVIQKHIVPALGFLPLCDLRTEHLQQLYRDRLEAGCSPQTVRRIHTILRSALAQAVRERKLPYNPADAVTLPPVRPKAKRALTPDEERRFLQAASADRLGVAFLLALATGMRRGEILALRWHDVNWEDSTIRVDESLVYVPGAGATVQDPKTRSSRRLIPVPAHVMAALDAHRDRMAQEENYTRDGLVFCTRHGTAILPRNFNRVFYRLRKQAGLPADLNLHCLRHTFSTRMLELGVDLKVVQELMGHSRLSMTDGYTHVGMALKRQAAELMDHYLSGTQRAQNEGPAQPAGP